MSNSLYDSYFSTVSTDRKSPTKQNNTNNQPPPKKLSKSFTRQLAKTLGTTTSKKKNKNKQNSKRKATSATKKMSKRTAPDTSERNTKKAKTSTTLPEKEKDKDGQVYWEISGKRRLQLSEFKGTTMIGVREFYEKDGEALPGRKGISMTVEQFNTVVELLPQIEKELGKGGIQLARPKYDSGGGEEVDGKEEDGDEGAEDGEDAEQDGEEKDGDAREDAEEEED